MRIEKKTIIITLGLICSMSHVFQLHGAKKKPKKIWFETATPQSYLVDRVDARTIEKEQEQALSTLTIEQAVEKSYHYKPNLLAYKHLIQAAKIDELETWTGYNPKIAFSSRVGSDNGTRFPHTTIGVAASQLVYNFAGPQELHSRAVKNTAVVRFQEQALQNNVRFEVEKSFLECWRIQQQRASINALYKSSTENFIKATEQNKNNLLDKNDWLIQVETHTNNISSIFVYEDGSSLSQKKLEFLLGYSFKLDIKPSAENKDSQNPITTLSWKASSEIQPIETLEYYYKAALENRPEIKEKQKLIEIQQVNINLARFSRLPVFALDASAGYDSDARESLALPSRSIGLSMNFPIFDGAVSDYETRKAESLKLEALLNKSQTIQDVRAEVETAYHTLMQEFTRFKAEKYRYERATNEFELQKLQFKIGNIANADFEQAKLNWSNEEFIWLNQRVALEIQYRQLMQSIGYPYR